MITSATKHTVAVFGNGEISVAVEEKDTTGYPSIRLSNCSPTTIGKKPIKVSHRDSIELVFLNLESLQVLIDRLEECKDSLESRREQSQAF